MNFRILLLAWFVLGATASGCSSPRYYFTDDVRFELRLFPRWGYQDPQSLHSPYALGTRVRITASGDENVAVRSANPSIMRCERDEDSTRGDSSYCTAVSVGTARLEIVDSQARVKRVAEVEVLAPDRIEIYSHGPLLLGFSDEEAIVTDVKVLQGGMATFAVRYFAEEQQLGGRGILSVGGVASLNPSAADTYFGVAHEWVQIEPTTLGRHVLQLGIGNGTIREVNVDVVASTEVADIAFRTEEDPGTDDGDGRVILVEGLSAEGDVIYGINYEWMIDGESAGLGDLYKYTYAEDQNRDVKVTFGEHEITGTIESSGGFVSSTNHLGCSVGMQSKTPMISWAFATLFALVVIRRRRVRTPS